jgi:hypothetical protein
MGLEAVQYLSWIDDNIHNYFKPKLKEICDKYDPLIHEYEKLLNKYQINNDDLRIYNIDKKSLWQRFIEWVHNLLTESNRGYTPVNYINSTYLPVQAKQLNRLENIFTMLQKYEFLAPNTTLVRCFYDYYIENTKLSQQEILCVNDNKLIISHNPIVNSVNIYEISKDDNVRDKLKILDINNNVITLESSIAKIYTAGGMGNCKLMPFETKPVLTVATS